MIFKLAFRSLVARKLSVGLTVFSLAVSMFVLLAVAHIKEEAKSSFTSTVSGVDLVVGARSGQLNLLLYSIFRIGNATNNISWRSYMELANHNDVAWTIPISLGDSHRGYRVMGTTESYFQFFKYGKKKSLTFDVGNGFSDAFEVVLGAEVAKKLNYVIGDKIFLFHGLKATHYNEHKDKPFDVVGILKPTGTAVDQTVHVRLDGLEAIHSGLNHGLNFAEVGQNEVLNNDKVTATSITAFLVGLKSKLSTFSYQRMVNQFDDEPLQAILPGVALSELWRMMGIVEKVLLVISGLVVASALLGMCTMMLATVHERQQEFTVLRTIGASPWFVLLLIEMEAFLISCLSVSLALTLLCFGIYFSQGVLANHGLNVGPLGLSKSTVGVVLTSLTATCTIVLIPAVAAYWASERVEVL